MAAEQKIADSGYWNPYMDSLIAGYKWADGPVTYAFGLNGILYYGIESLWVYSWSKDEKSMFRSVLASYSAVCNIKFKEVGFNFNSSSVDMIEWKFYQAPTDKGILLGVHSFPDNDADQNWGFFNALAPLWSTARGSLTYATIVHEMGHAIGLAHPHDGGKDDGSGEKFPGVDSSDALGTDGQNQGIWTAMSYNRGWASQPDKAPQSIFYGDVLTPMALDIHALQLIYGATTRYNHKSTTYTLFNANQAGTGWACIWDTGGSDTITAGSTWAHATIDLREAPITTGLLQDGLTAAFGENAGGYVSSIDGIIGGFTIANGVVIENAMGGNGNDLIIGNAANNRLDGGLGADTMYGGLGNDVYLVDDVGDVVTEFEETGVDLVRASVSVSARPEDEAALISNHVEQIELTGLAELFAVGNAQDNRITGNSAGNVLQAGQGKDTLLGKGGLDKLFGGDGADTFCFDTKPSGLNNWDTVQDFNAAEDTLVLSRSVFSKLARGTLASNALVVDSNPISRKACLLYNNETGALSYDADGIGKGKAVLFAVIDPLGLQNGPLTSGQILVA